MQKYKLCIYIEGVWGLLIAARGSFLCARGGGVEIEVFLHIADQMFMNAYPPPPLPHHPGHIKWLFHKIARYYYFHIY